MSNEIVETYGVPDITADGIANVRVIQSDMHFHYWAWQLTPCGILQRVLVARFRMAMAGVQDSRPLITAALQGKEPSFHRCPVLERVAH